MIELLEGLQNFRATELVRYASQAKAGFGHKSLCVTLNGEYVVLHNGKEVLRDKQAFPAIEKYLSIELKQL